MRLAGALALLSVAACSASVVRRHDEMSGREEIHHDIRSTDTGAVVTEDHEDQRIVGGEEADIKTVPYQVSIELRKAHICGGSVLSASWILTAAHCVYDQSTASLQVRAGTDKLQSGGSVHLVLVTVPHTKYSYEYDRADWDVALVKLGQPLILGATIKAVRLPSSGREPTTNAPVVASGWGLTKPQYARSAPSLPKQLRKVTVRIINRGECTAVYTKAVLTERMICAAAPGKDSCTYDSGGPLVDSSGVQLGVVSWGRGCADPRYPGVYTHLGNKDMRSFIKNNTGL